MAEGFAERLDLAGVLALCLLGNGDRLLGKLDHQRTDRLPVQLLGMQMLLEVLSSLKIIPAAGSSTFSSVASNHFPIVLLSHGGGVNGGTPFLLRDVSAALARHGFVVIAPFHGKTGLQSRPLQVKLVLDAVLADPRFIPHVDPTRLGMFGFSLGAAVTLELAGATPNTAHLVSYCAAHPEGAMSCDHAPNAYERPSAGPETSSGYGELAFTAVSEGDCPA